MGIIKINLTGCFLTFTDYSVLKRSYVFNFIVKIVIYSDYVLFYFILFLFFIFFRYLSLVMVLF